MRVLNAAWHSIRRNAETSRTKSTRETARKFGQDLPANLRSLSDRLRRGYKFDKAYGATPLKGLGKDGKRPIVVAPLPDRIVQRAILDVLQSAAHLTEIQKVLATPTSIGGIPGRGVDTAIDLFEECAGKGYKHIAGSDIAGFFTKIPKLSVSEFLKAEIEEPEFIQLVEAALKVELRNANVLNSDDLLLFPLGPDGVAQGCPLSALAGNIVLRHFDREMNERGLVCIRYIDDFIVVGKKADSVDKGMAAAGLILAKMGMTVYHPDENPTKAFRGRIGDKHVFLGHELIPGRYPPAQVAIARFKKSIDDLISDGQRAIAKAVAGKRLKATDKTFAPTVVAINHAVRGWRGTYGRSHCPDIFNDLDKWVSRRLKDFEQYLHTKTSGVSSSVRQQALGVSLLEDFGR